MRVVTWLDGDQVKVVDAALKMGRGDYPADNPFGRGGIVVPVDLATGVCGKPVSSVEGRLQRQDHHPVTGVRITGLKVPHWHEVIDVARLAAESCGFLSHLSWDIGVTASGPIIVEGTWCPDPALNQIGCSSGLIDTEWGRELARNKVYKGVGVGLFQAWRR